MTQKPVSVISSDHHLKETTWASHPNMRGDTFYSLQQIVDYCVNHELSLSLLGDVFDVKYPSSESVCFAYEQLNRLPKGGYFIEGQHEKAKRTPWLAATGLVQADKKIIQFGNNRTYFLTHRNRENLLRELDEMPSGVSTVCMHQVWYEFMGSLTESWEIGAFEFSGRGISTIFTGDLHSHLTKSVPLEDGSTVALVSPGSTAMQSMVESEDKYFFVLCDDRSYFSVPLKTRRVSRNRIYSLNDLEVFLHNLSDLREQHDDPSLPEEIRTPILFVEFSLDVPDVSARVRAAAADRWHVKEKIVRPEKKVDKSTPFISQASAPMLADFLPVVCQKNSDVFLTSQRLLNAGRDKKSVETEIENIIQEKLSS